MGLFSKKPRQPVRQTTVVHVEGVKKSRASGLVYRDEDSTRAFAAIEPQAAAPVIAVLRPMPPNEWNPTPIEVWVNGYCVAWVRDEDAPRYWRTLTDLFSTRAVMVSCNAQVMYAVCGVSKSGDYEYCVNKLILLLPESITV